MLINSKFEFRGYSSTLSKDKTKTYTFFNVEDSTGESCKFLSEIDGNKLQKGKVYNFVLDYSPRYTSIRIVGVE